MTERTHTLTDEDIAEIIRLGCVFEGNVTLEEALSALPSRNPKDPDAGLGAQPWRESGLHIQSGEFSIGWVSRRGRSPHDPAAVSRAILAAPKAIKLARALRFACRPGGRWIGRDELIETLMGLDTLAAEVLAIADGEEQP